MQILSPMAIPAAHKHAWKRFPTWNQPAGLSDMVIEQHGSCSYGVLAATGWNQKMPSSGAGVIGGTAPPLSNSTSNRNREAAWSKYHRSACQHVRIWILLCIFNVWNSVSGSCILCHAPFVRKATCCNTTGKVSKGTVRTAATRNLCAMGEPARPQSSGVPRLQTDAACKHCAMHPYKFGYSSTATW